MVISQYCNSHESSWRNRGVHYRWDTAKRLRMSRINHTRIGLLTRAIELGAIWTIGLDFLARLAMQDRVTDVQDGIRTRSRQTVRRKLFEDDDDNDGQHISTGLDDNFNNHLIEEHKKELDEKKKRWNFDFKKEEPLPGRWEWSKVEFEDSENSQEENLENSQATMISNNEETDSSDVTRETRANRPKSESDSDISLEN